MARPGQAYAAETAYPVYMLHQTLIIAIGFYIVRLAWAPWLAWQALVVASTAACLAVYEVAVRRWGPVRFMFGMRPQRPLAPPDGLG